MIRAIAFDLNGTLSDDEGLYFEIFSELFEREGKPVSPERYWGELVGHVDEQIVRLWLGDDFPRIDELLAERIERFLAAAEGGRTVPPHAREAVQAAAAAVPVAVVSGAFRREVNAILDGAGLSALFATTVALDDVTHAKPHPEAYLLAAARLGLEPGEMLAFEDTAVGVEAAKAAGLQCVAVLGSMEPELLHGADSIAERLDATLIARLIA